jgi:serine/threonine protein kinase
MEGALPQTWPNAAELLTGSTLDGGWKVVELLPRRPGATGGNFSVGYRVEHPDGRQGFCKALDYASALSRPNTPEALHLATEEYIFERDLHRKCEERRMSRILTALDDGQTFVPNCPIGQVDYIIFELAQYDVRRALDVEADLEATLRLRALHNVAAGLRQLHQAHIAHQDVKPSNVLILRNGLGERSSKLGDLGRATDAGRPALHDVYAIAGDRQYAPPEQLYGAVPVEFGPRRLACDIYQLGGLTTFMFTGATMNSLLSAELHPSHSWLAWSGTYSEVLPYVRDAFGRILEKIRASIGSAVAGDVTDLIRHLCEPEPTCRGYAVSKIGGGNPYALQKVVSRFDLLARRASKGSLVSV